PRPLHRGQAHGEGTVTMKRAVLSIRIVLDTRDAHRGKDAAERHGLKLEVAFDVPPGVTVLFGPSGAGKSRTLACVAGLVRPDSGRVALGDELWFDSDRREQVAIHERRVAYVFQSLALFPHMTAAENVAYGLPRDVSKEARRARALEMLA